jgi:hypothetical protein
MRTPWCVCVCVYVCVCAPGCCRVLRHHQGLCAGLPAAQGPGPLVWQPLVVHRGRLGEPRHRPQVRVVRRARRGAACAACLRCSPGRSATRLAFSRAQRGTRAHTPHLTCNTHTHSHRSDPEDWCFGNPWEMIRPQGFVQQPMPDTAAAMIAGHKAGRPVQAAPWTPVGRAAARAAAERAAARRVRPGWVPRLAPLVAEMCVCVCCVCVCCVCVVCACACVCCLLVLVCTVQRALHHHSSPPAVPHTLCVTSHHVMSRRTFHTQRPLAPRRGLPV